MNQILLFTLLIVIALFSPASIYAQAIKPNIVIFLADDMGYGDISPYNSLVDYTPNFETLAAESVLLTSFYVPVSVCTPTRASLLTGRYPVRYGLNTPLLPGDPGVPPGLHTLPEVLASNGYETAITGKWHLGDTSPSMPNDNGFDYSYGTPYSNSVDPYYIWQGGQIIEDFPDQRTLTDKFTNEAVSFIQTADEPFFLYLPYAFPHIPQFSANEGQTGQGIYADSVADIDASVGIVLAALDARGVATNTVVIFTSDNGPRDVEHTNPAQMMASVTGKMPYLTDWQATHTGYDDLLNPDRWQGGSLENDFRPFRESKYNPDGSILARAGKSSVNEGGLIVPALIRWPGVAPGVVSEQVIMMDLYETLIIAAGGAPPWSDGEDIYPVLLGGQRSSNLFHFYHQSGEYKAIQKWGGWKLVFAWGGDFTPQFLYHLPTDPTENNNLINSYPGIVASLTSQAIAADSKMRP